MRFMIESKISAAHLGIHEGETASAAIEAMYKDAGYDGSSGFASALGKDPETVGEDLIATEIFDVTPMDPFEADRNLISSIEEDGLIGAQVAYFDSVDPEFPDHRVQIAFVEAANRAGVVSVGPGSDGNVRWTDAWSAQEAMDRYVSGQMSHRSTRPKPRGGIAPKVRR